MVARRLESFAVAVGSLPSVAVFVALLLSVVGLFVLERLEPGWPRAVVVAACDAIAFGWMWSAGAVAARAHDGALGRGARAWAAIVVATIVLRGWIELADPVTVRGGMVASPAQAVTLFGAALVIVTNFGLPIWAAVRLGAVRPEPWRWIQSAGAAVLVAFAPIGVWWVQPWLHELLQDPPTARR